MLVEGNTQLFAIRPLRTRGAAVTQAGELRRCLALPPCKARQARFQVLSSPLALLRPHLRLCSQRSKVFPLPRVLWMQVVRTLTHAWHCSARFCSLLAPHTLILVHALHLSPVPAPCILALMAKLVGFVNALLLRFFFEGTWSSLWVNFDCKKLPRRDSQNASGSDSFTFSLGEFQGGGKVLLPPPVPHSLCPRHLQ